MFVSYCVYIGTFLAGILCIKKYRRLSFRNNRRKWEERIYLALAIIIPSIIAGIRYDVGIDWSTYKSIYGYMPSAGSSYLEIGYVWLIRLVKYVLRGDYYFFNFVVSSIILGFLLMAMMRINKITGCYMPVELGYFIAFVVIWGVSFNVTRQCLACAIVLYGYTWILEKKWKYVLWVILASLFHQSALFCLFFIFLLIDFKQKINQRIYNIVLSLGIIFLCAKMQSVIEIIKMFGLYTNYFDSRSSEVNFGFLLYIVFPLILIIVYAPKELKENKYYILFFKLFLLQIPIQIAGNYVAYADRISLYCNVSQIILFPLIASQIKNVRIKKQFMMVSYMWYIIYFIVMWGIFRANGVFPYQTHYGI